MAVPVIVANIAKKAIFDKIQEKYPGGVPGFVATLVLVFILLQYFLITAVIYSLVSGGTTKEYAFCESPYSQDLAAYYTDEELADLSSDDLSVLNSAGFNTYFPGRVSYNTPEVTLTAADTALANDSALAGSDLIYPLYDNTGVIYGSTNTALRLGPTAQDQVIAPADATVYRAEQTQSYGGTIIFKIDNASAGSYANAYIEYSRLDPTSITVKDGDTVKQGDTVGVIADVGDAESGKHIRVVAYGSAADSTDLVPLGNTTAWYTASSAGWYLDTTGTPASGPGFNGGGGVCVVSGGLGGVGAVGDGQSAVGPWGGFSNGRIPDSALLSLGNTAPGHRLAPGAAMAFMYMDAAYFADFGSHIRINSSYRSYSAQVITYATKGSDLAAVPGTSNHGWGEALDISTNGGYSGETYKWLTENGPKFGYVNPYWALQGRGREEPWHWEYIYPPG